MTNQFTNNKKISALLYMLVGLFSLLIFLKNAWVTEDAFIILRSVDQFLLGHGFRWNPHERVQVYTSPLWYLLIIASTFFCKTLYLNLISLSLLLHIALLVAMAVFIKNIWRWLAAALLLTLSQGFFDFTASGLEYPLVYLLLAAFVLLYLRDRPIEDRYWLALCGGLALITRHDLLFILTPMLLHLAWNYRHSLTRQQQFAVAAIFIAPLFCWTLFSLIYYGMPFPNTAYAKLGISGVSRIERLERGLIYLSVSLRYDPITPLCIGLAILQGFCSHNTHYKMLGTSLSLALLYVIWIGADYMMGRFFAPLYIVSVILLVMHPWHKPLAHRMTVLPLAASLTFLSYYMLAANIYNPALGKLLAMLPPPTQLQVQATFALLCFSLFVIGLFSLTNRRMMAALLALLLAISTQQFDSPWQTSYKNWGRVDDIWWNINNVSRERYWIYRWTSLYAWFHQDHSKKFPDHPWCREGQAMPQVEVLGLAGMIPYCMGTDKIAIDVKAITDPLLTRMPKSPEAIWASGGVNRIVPAGYIASVVEGQNKIEDPDLARYYSKLLILTHSEPLLSAERLRTIAAFNLGLYDHWLQAHNDRITQSPH